MAIITISRGSYSRGKEVAEQVAARLGYDCISREVLLDASQRFNIPEVKLIRAIHNTPGMLDRFGHDRRAYIAYIRSALIQRVRKDKVVYHGLAGHFLIEGISHVLKVRIISDLNNRISAEAAREHISREKAKSLLQKDDQERRKWAQALYGKDPWDSSLYDLVIQIQKLHVDDAVDFICQAAAKQQFCATDASQQRIDDLFLACQIKAAVVEIDANAGVTSEYGNVLIYTQTGERTVRRLQKRIQSLNAEYSDINNLEIRTGPAPSGAV